MFENYKAQPHDFEAIKSGISFAWRPELEFVFADKLLFSNLSVVSYDSEFVFIWTAIPLKNTEKIPYSTLGFRAYKIPHKFKIKDENQRGWSAGIAKFKELEKLLPKELKGNQYDRPGISGGLLTPFTEIQKTKPRIHNAYITYESYLATIVHEFGHIYFNQHKRWWYSDRKENLSLLESAQKFYQGTQVNLAKLKIRIPTDKDLGEVFAFCTDYTAAKIFWSNHKADIDKMNLARLPKLIKVEKKKNLDQEDSVLQESTHDLSTVIGRLLVEKYPQTWPQILLKPIILQ